MGVEQGYQAKKHANPEGKIGSQQICQILLGPLNGDGTSLSSGDESQLQGEIPDLNEYARYSSAL